jgi:hypothetical protein
MVFLDMLVDSNKVKKMFGRLYFGSTPYRYEQSRFWQIVLGQGFDEVVAVVKAN